MKAGFSVNGSLTMRRSLAVVGFTLLLASAAGSFTALPVRETVPEAGSSTFLIPASDGYGVAECLESASECGRMVAGAWCEAHGFKVALQFGPALPEDLTGSVEGARSGRPIAITCGN